MPKDMHKENKSATKVSVVPCLLMIIFLPFILLYFICTLLFVPIDYVIFKRSRYHRAFGGRYSFLSGAHPDNELFTLIEKHKLPIRYTKKDSTYESEGCFTYNGVLIAAHADLFFAEGEWRMHTPDADMTLDSAAAAMLASIPPTAERRCERVVFLVRGRTLRRAGAAAISLAEADERLVPFTKGSLAEVLKGIIAKEDGLNSL